MCIVYMLEGMWVVCVSCRFRLCGVCVCVYMCRFCVTVVCLRCVVCVSWGGVFEIWR